VDRQEAAARNNFLALFARVSDDRIALGGLRLPPFVRSPSGPA
jgi:hypothetical protein